MDKRGSDLLFLFLVFFFVAFVMWGCGYTLVGGGPSKGGSHAKVHLEGKSLVINTFHSTIDEPGVESIVTAYVKSEFVKDGRVKVVAAGGEYTLDGTVVTYEKNTLALNKEGDTAQYRLTVGVDLVLKDRAGNVVWSSKDLRDSQEYQSYREIERNKASEREALKEAARDIAVMVTGLLL
jgi:outer membrane lipopolysaccharide assembly protein LptE/RlpB